MWRAEGAGEVYGQLSALAAVRSSRADRFRSLRSSLRLLLRLENGMQRSVRNQRQQREFDVRIRQVSDLSGRYKSPKSQLTSPKGGTR